MTVDVISRTKELVRPKRKRRTRERFGSADILPSIIAEPFPFVAIGDLYEVVRKFDPKTKKRHIKSLQAELFRLEQSFAPERSTFFYTDADSLNKRLEAISLSETERTDKRVGVIQMDRYIASDVENPHFFRLDISRGADNKPITRPGATLSPTEQLQRLAEWTRDGNYNELVFVDDVLAFADTLIPLIGSVKADNPQVGVKVIVGLAASGGSWRGLEKVQEVGIPVQHTTRINASPEIADTTLGMAIPVSRDFTIFGGKIGQDQSGNQLCFPYFLPFSKPMVSVTRPTNKFESSTAYIDFSRKFVTFIEKRIGRPLTIQDLVDKGIGIPHTSVKCLQNIMQLPSPETTVRDYLSYAEKVMLNNRDAITVELQAK